MACPRDCVGGVSSHAVARTLTGYRLEPDGGVYFYGGPLSNFAVTPIELDGELWPSVEHYFQAQKTAKPGDSEAIRRARTPRDGKRMGRIASSRSDWDELKVGVMLHALRAKFTQHPPLRELLLSTGDRPIFEDSPTDRIWGYRNGGLNLLGKALMQIRDELRRSG
jgi:N-glycosidase YbiA